MLLLVVFDSFLFFFLFVFLLFVCLFVVFYGGLSLFFSSLSVLIIFITKEKETIVTFLIIWLHNIHLKNDTTCFSSFFVLYFLVVFFWGVFLSFSLLFLSSLFS